MAKTSSPIAAIWVCQDCMIANVNEGERLDYVQNGGHFRCETSPDFDASEDNKDHGFMEFATSRCEGCGSALAGQRFRFAVWSWA